MERSDKSARQLYEEIKAKPARARFGFGRKPALVNVDLQNAYTRPQEFVTAYETDPRQMDYVNALARLFRTHRCPVVWTYVAYLDSGEDCGVWGTRTDTPDSLQNIKVDSHRSGLQCERWFGRHEPKTGLLRQPAASRRASHRLGAVR